MAVLGKCARAHWRAAEDHMTLTVTKVERAGSKMPRQKFCSVPGCLSTTDVIKREQEIFLSAYCSRCSIQRPCRCPAPDIYTTRRETRTKFASWCNAIGLRSPGYYINVCYKHFSSGCPSRACPNPDVVKPVQLEKKDKEEAARKQRRRRRRSSGSQNAITMLKKAEPVMPTQGRTSSLLRDALLLPRSANPQHRRGSAMRPPSGVFNSVQVSPASSSSVKQVIVMLTPTYSALPTSIALPQTPVPLSQLSNTMQIQRDTPTPSSMTPPSSSNSSSGTKEDDEESVDIMEDLMNIDESMLLEMMEAKKPGDEAKEGFGGPLTLPLLDQSDDPYLNEGGEPLSFVTDELDETVQKWMESCDVFPSSS